MFGGLGLKREGAADSSASGASSALPPVLFTERSGNFLVSCRKPSTIKLRIAAVFDIASVHC